MRGTYVRFLLLFCIGDMINEVKRRRRRSKKREPLIWHGPTYTSPSTSGSIKNFGERESGKKVPFRESWRGGDSLRNFFFGGGGWNDFFSRGRGGKEKLHLSVWKVLKFGIFSSAFLFLWFEFLFFRCENYAITLLEQCENLEEVETFLQTKTHDGREHKDANYIMAILVRYY